ncbi:hypothetical protein FB451DRAFT_1291575 [Mycena latifolia]|nr:hypothetical protein FB451DRAFT_1291575 [Mycena latifolia]
MIISTSINHVLEAFSLNIAIPLTENQTWAAALEAYNTEDFEKALSLFARIPTTPRTLTNMGLINATMWRHEAAIERFLEATRRESHLAIAYFQCGVSHFMIARYQLAYQDFTTTLQYLQGNSEINYEPLGLNFRLFAAEVLFNRGLSLIHLGRGREGLVDMEKAKRLKAIDEHNVIDDAIQRRGEGYAIFSIPVGVLYHPTGTEQFF